MAGCITVEQREMKKFTQPASPALIVTNPPYGERLVTPDLLGLYRTIGERLKHEFSGGEAWIISYRQECFDEIGLKPSFKVPLFNGSLDCEFRKYQLFSGKLDDFRAAGGEVKTTEERTRMAEKKRFKQHRGEFNGRFAENQESNRRHDNEDYNPEYELLRRKHRDFQERFNRGERNERQEKPGRRENGERGTRRTTEWKSFDRRGGEHRGKGSRRRTPWRPPRLWQT